MGSNPILAAPCQRGRPVPCSAPGGDRIARLPACKLPRGGLAERSKAHAWKACRGLQPPRGFEPLSLRYDLGLLTCGFPERHDDGAVLGPRAPRAGRVPDPFEPSRERLHLGREQVPVGVGGAVMVLPS